MPSSTGQQPESKMKPGMPSLHVRLPSTDSGIQADAGFDSLSRYKGKNFLSSSGQGKGESTSSSSNTNISSTSSSSSGIMMTTSDLIDGSHSSSSLIHSPCSSSGYSSEARGATPPSLFNKASRESTPPPLPPKASTSSDRSVNVSSKMFQSKVVSTSSSLPSSDMTSSWAGVTSYSKSKPQVAEVNPLLTRASVPSGNREATSGKFKSSSTVQFPPKPKGPPPKRPVVANSSSRPIFPSAAPPTPARGGVKVTTSTNQDGGVQVSITRPQHPTSSTGQSNINSQNVSQTNQRSTTTVQNLDDRSHSQSKTTIDVRPSPGSTVKVKVIGSGAGAAAARPQPQPRPTPRQGQGCIPLTRPLRMATPPSTSSAKKAPPRIGHMSQPPPPPPHSEQLQQLQQRQQQHSVPAPVPQTGSKPRPLAPKPQVSPRKAFLSSANPVHPTNNSFTTTSTSSTTVATMSKSGSHGISATTATVSVNNGALGVSQNTNSTVTTTVTTTNTTQSIGTRNVSLYSPKPLQTSLNDSSTSSNTQTKSGHDSHSLYKSPKGGSAAAALSSTAGHLPTASTTSTTTTTTNTSSSNSIDSCTFMYKSPEKSFFTQTFYTKDSSGGKVTPTSSSMEQNSDLSSPSTYPSSFNSSYSSSIKTAGGGSQDSRHLGFIRDDLKSGDTQSRMRHAELILKRSDELFKDAWSFLNASDDEIDRCLFGEGFLSSHSPSPDRTNGLRDISRKASPGLVSKNENKVVKHDIKLLDSSLAASRKSESKPAPIGLEKDGTKVGDEDSVSWKVRKERIDSALSWLKQELASLRDMDKNIVNQFRRCQDTIETLKSQREIWEGLSEEGEEAEYWDDLEINEFNRNYLNSPGGSSLSPMSTGSRDFFPDVSTVVTLPVPAKSPSSGSVKQDVEARL